MTEANHYKSPATLEHDGVHVQDLNKKLSASSFSSWSSPRSSLDDNPFGEDDKELIRNIYNEDIMMQSSPDVDGVHFQELSKKSRSFSGASALEDDDNHHDFDHKEPMQQSNLALHGVHVQELSKDSRPSSPSSSASSGSLFDRHFGYDFKETNGESLVLRSLPSDLAGVDDHFQDANITSRSSTSSCSSLDSPLDGHFRKDDGHMISAMRQSSSAVDEVDFQGLSNKGKSSSACSSPSGSRKIEELVTLPSPDLHGMDVQSPRTKSSGSFRETIEDTRNSSKENLTIKTSPVIDRVDVHSPRNISRSSSTSSSSSPDSPLKDLLQKANEESMNISSANVDKDDIHAPTKLSRSLSSSSSSSSSSDDDENEKHHKPVPRTTASLQPEDEYKDGKHEEAISKNSEPKDGSRVSTQGVNNHNPPESNVGNVSKTEAPAAQVMERTTKSNYRIPSHVFATEKSNVPTDWSTNSNESLFSIHMGNMSFTRDDISLKPELGIPGDSSGAPGQKLSHQHPTSPLPAESSTPGPGDMFSYSSNQRQNPGNKSKNGGSEAAFETMKEVIHETEDFNRSMLIGEGGISHISYRSAGSGTSTASFAFPILADGEKSRHSASIDGGSTRNDTEHQQQGSQKVSSPKTPTSPPASQPASQPSEQPEPKGPVGAPFGLRWLSCMSCCIFFR